MKVSWISYLDPYAYHGGGELSHRRIIEAGRRRGHDINISAFLRGRASSGARRLGLATRLRVDWDADLFILANLRNCPHLRPQIPDAVVERALATGRAAVLEDAWVDVCAFDMVCGGDRARCHPDCERSFADYLYSRARLALFVSPAQRDRIAKVVDAELPPSILVYPMIDPDLFRPLGLRRDIDVLYVGTISAAKGYYDVLERFGASRLAWVGPNYLGHDVEGVYLGERTQDELPFIYNRARVFAHLPRWYEPMGRAVCEASLCGCEVVTNERVGAMSFASEHRLDPSTVRSHPDRLWAEIEANGIS